MKDKTLSRVLAQLVLTCSGKTFRKRLPRRSVRS